MPTAPPTGTWRALGYVRVTRGADACEIEAHSQTIRTQCAKSQLSVVTVVHDVETPGNARSNPALDWAIERIDEGDAQTLVVPSLRHLANSVANLPPLLQWFTEPQRRLVVIDLGLDTAAEAGRIAAFALMGVGDWEHERLSVRTRQGLEAARARGAARGRAAVDDVPELRERIIRLRNQGLTLQAIADTLNADGVPTLRGGAKWRPSSVQRSLGYRRPAPQRGLSLLSPAPADTADLATPDA